jgi:hypothetical protein
MFLKAKTRLSRANFDIGIRAGVPRLERGSTVLETVILPLNYTPKI